MSVLFGSISTSCVNCVLGTNTSPVTEVAARAIATVSSAITSTASEIAAVLPSVAKQTSFSSEHTLLAHAARGHSTERSV